MKESLKTDKHVTYFGAIADGLRRPAETPSAREGLGEPKKNFASLPRKKTAPLQAFFVLGALPRPQSEARARAKSGVAGDKNHMPRMRSYSDDLLAL